MLKKNHGLAANILVSYFRLSNIPPEGRHAAHQLLLRLDYLNFENYTAVADLVSFLSFLDGSEFDNLKSLFFYAHIATYARMNPW